MTNGTIATPSRLTANVLLVVQAFNRLTGVLADGVNAPRPLPAYSKTALPPATATSALIYVTDEVGGAVPAFSDGTDWRRVTDRAIVS